MNNDNSYTIYCSRCGAPMKSDARYCMKCGNLNPDHPDNKSMEKYIPEKQNYVIGAGRTIVGHMNQSGTISKSFANNTGDSKMCFIVTFSIYILVILLNVLFTLLNYNITDISDASNLIYTNLPDKLLIVSVLFMMVFASERLYMKTNHPWWAALIPIYNNLLFSKIVLGNFWLGILGFIPIVNIVFYCIIFYKLGKKFGKSGILTVLFPFIMVPVIGLGDSLYNGISYVNASLDNGVEKEYKRKRVFFVTSVLIIILSFVCIIYTNLTSIDERVNRLKDKYLVYVSSTVVKKINQEVSSNEFKVMCDDDIYSGEDGVYYFEYSDVSDQFNIFLGSFVDPISVVVRMDVVHGEKTYYVSLTDGNRGFDNIESSSIDVNSVTDFSEIGDYSSFATECYFG